MAHDPDNSTDHDEGDEIVDFEAFLRQKDKQWTKSPQELKTTDLTKVQNLDDIFEIQVVVDVVENSNPETKSIETTESIPESSSKSVESVENAGDSEEDESEDGDEPSPLLDAPLLERGTEITIKTHPITGTYIHEESVAWRYDPQALEIFSKFLQLAVTDIPLEDIIKRIAKMERAYKLIRIAEQGLHSGMAQRLAKMNDAERAKYNEMSRQAALKNQTRQRINRREKAAGGASIGKAARKTAGKTALQKRVDVLKFNGLDKEYVLSHLKQTNKLDAAIAAYVESLSW